MKKTTTNSAFESFGMRTSKLNTSKETAKRARKGKCNWNWSWTNLCWAQTQVEFSASCCFFLFLFSFVFLQRTRFLFIYLVFFLIAQKCKRHFHWAVTFMHSFNQFLTRLSKNRNWMHLTTFFLILVFSIESHFCQWKINRSSNSLWLKIKYVFFLFISVAFLAIHNCFLFTFIYKIVFFALVNLLFISAYFLLL